MPMSLKFRVFERFEYGLCVFDAGTSLTLPMCDPCENSSRVPDIYTNILSQDLKVHEGSAKDNTMTHSEAPSSSVASNT